MSITDIRAEARKLTPKCLKVLTGVMCSAKAPAAARVTAAFGLLDRGWGKPEASIKLDVRDERSTADVLAYIDKIFNVLPTSAGALPGPVIEGEVDDAST